MAYSPDPTVVTEPLDSTDARTAAAEFRALKAYIAGLTLGNQNAALYRKNLLHNGSFAVVQRFGLAGVSAVDAYAADRWKLKRNFSANITSGVFPGATNLNPSGGNNYLGIGANAAGIAPAAAQYAGLEQTLEYTDIDHLSPGWAHAKTITFSGWINAPVTGTLPVYVQNPARTRSWMSTITIAAAAIWQRFEVVIPLDITGVWTANPTDPGLIVGFSLACGANFQSGTLQTWQAGDIRSTAAQTNFLGTSGWVTYFNGLQLEPGGASTTFEKRPHAVELEICQRYYETSWGQNLAALPLVTDPQGAYAVVNITAAGTNRFPFHFRTKKRIIPTMTFPLAARNVTNSTTGGTPTLTAASLSESGGLVNVVGAGSWVVSHGVMFAYAADSDF